jgi:circadian clock protein KaiB
MAKPSSDPLPDEEPRAETAETDTLQEFEKLVAGLLHPRYLFRLYVAGGTSRSSRAITNIRRICEEYLAGYYELEVIDVYQQPAVTKTADVIALPTLIKELPLPPKRFVGDMSNTERIVVELKLRT